MTIEYGFHGCLEADAFRHVLDNHNISYDYKTMESMDNEDYPNPERYEDLFFISSIVTLPELAISIHENEIDEYELWDLTSCKN
jgi:hypothetical protein